MLPPSSPAGSHAIVALVGPPGAGTGALAYAVARARPDVLVVDHAAVRAAMDASTSPTAKAARASVVAGLLVPDGTLGRLLAEIASAAPGPVLLAGYPRSRAQLEHLSAASARPLAVVHVDASRLAAGLQLSRGCKRPEDASPDAQGRIEAALQPLLERAEALGVLHTLEVERAPEELASAVAGLL